MSDPRKTELYKMLKTVLRDPIVIVIEGDWRTGKTNNALLFAYLAQKWGIVHEIGTNIVTGKSPVPIHHIEQTGRLQQWMHRNRAEKIYILDEALKTIYRRKAMSKLSIKILTEIMPEVSKGHTRLWVLTQINKLDSDVLHPAFHRATWTCQERGVMECKSKHYPRRVFTGLPPSPIQYDPDTTAKFIDKDLLKLSEIGTLPRILQAADLYSKGKTLSQIGGVMNLHRQQVKRELQKAMKWLVDNHEQVEKGISKAKKL